ncbi:MAG: alpha/beta hydrolase [Nocardioidaceae bacterium]
MTEHPTDRRPDVLGEPYTAETIELPDDAEGPVVATLVRLPGEAPRERAVLYVHGFNDYFFQTGVADFFTAQGYDFYALDLRKYGRSLLAHQTPNFCIDVHEYFAELDEAYDRITQRDGHSTVLVVAHSTGGLIAPLWSDQRRRDGRPLPVGFVLNSPWLDLQGSALLRTVGTRAIDQIGARRPYQVIPRSTSGVYAESLHRDHRGEWDFDLTLKPLQTFTVRAGWLRAIRRAHRELHRGIDAGAPVLVLCSTRTVFTNAWSDDVPRTDIVLDVKQIARWAHQLDRVVTIARIDGAVHDVFLSGPDARACAYGYTRTWLNAVLPPRDE